MFCRRFSHLKLLTPRAFKKIVSFSSKAIPAVMKIDSPEFHSVFTCSLRTLVGLFAKNNHEIRIAGGAVRDILLGKHPKDIDFATTATPDQMKTMFDDEGIRMINTKGEKHGTITARIGDENFEVTTLRIDVVTDGRHAEIKFTKDWELDAGRRDLTVNSMFLGIDGTLYDYFGGWEDLEKRRIVFVNEPEKRIQEDYLRILRYFRFYGRLAELPNAHEEDIIKAITNNVSGLSKITGERIWQELSKILSGNYASNLLQKIIEVGAGPFIGLPNNPDIDGLIRLWEQGKNLSLNPITVLVSVMHTVEDFMTFHSRCKLSGFERDLGIFLITNRNLTKGSHCLKEYQELLFKSEGKMMDTSKFIEELLKYKADILLLHEFRMWEPPKFPVSGHDLKEAGVPSGKSFGKILKSLKQVWIGDCFKPTKEELIKLIPDIANKFKVELIKKNAGDR